VKNQNKRPPAITWVPPASAPLTILLAEDDPDDCLLFKEALNELQLNTQLRTVGDGEQLMQLLTGQDPLPDLLFMDINMPLKNGLECLSDIRLDKHLDQLPIVIISTSADKMKTDLFHQNGAQHFIHKPNEFYKLKRLINKALQLTLPPSPTSIPSHRGQPNEDLFLIT
jgi:CheY-like chemotaxis protein